MVSKAFLATTATCRCHVVTLLDPRGTFPGKSCPRTSSAYYPRHWSAIGDSYSAGPGAGDAYDEFEYNGHKCYSSKGAYAPQLDAERYDQIGNFQFLPCTGHITSDVTAWQIPDLNWGGLVSNMWVSLSIGGNDLMFSKYVMACLLKLRTAGNCDQVIDDIENLIDNKDGKNTFRDSLVAVWKSLITHNHSQNPRLRTYVPIMTQTLYPRFFDDTTDQCDNERILGVGPKLTKELRRQTNDLVGRANVKIRDHQIAFRRDPKNFEFLGRYDLLDYNSVWSGHRLCESSITDGIGFSDDRCWILGVGQPDSEDPDAIAPEAPDVSQVNPATCNPNAADYGEAYGCLVARAIAEDPNNSENEELLTVLPRWVTKAFHPKTAGFTAVERALAKKWIWDLPDLRVLALGDSITNGFKSTDGSGYKGVFYELANRDDNFKVDMIGSVQAGSVADNDNEGYHGAVISEISGYADMSLEHRPNLILLHAGTNNMASEASAAGAVGRLESLIDKILLKCPDATLLVAKIIQAADAGTMSRINTYNVGVEAAVKSRADSGRHVMWLGMDEVVTTSYLSDGLHPNDEGYARMGIYWYNALNEAVLNGWIQHPVPGAEPGQPAACPNVPTWIPQGEVASGGGFGAGLLDESTCFEASCGDGDFFNNQYTCAAGCSRDGICTEEDGGYRCSDCIDPGKKCWCTNFVQECKLIDIPDDGDCEVRASGYNAVHFADLDGDGRDDYLWVDRAGKVTMLIPERGQCPRQRPQRGQGHMVSQGRRRHRRLQPW
ncbi:SGNH hydrolase-type esterase domain-containing protein [Xylariaceae sp. FL1272]|nr:SGNH hydrolase-type esterase domain-containing protein [Xylariaceae sp. FL1272]